MFLTKEKKDSKFKRALVLIFDIIMVLFLIYDIVINKHLILLIILIGYIYLAVKSRGLKNKEEEVKEQKKEILQEENIEVPKRMILQEENIEVPKRMINERNVRSFDFSKKK